jgi:hypothetical protein
MPVRNQEKSWNVGLEGFFRTGFYFMATGAVGVGKLTTVTRIGNSGCTSAEPTEAAVIEKGTKQTLGESCGTCFLSVPKAAASS